MLRQRADELPNGSIPPRLAQLIEPAGLELLDRVGESLRFYGRPCGRVGELPKPPAHVAFSVAGEPGDVRLRLRREDQADRRDVVGGFAAPAQDRVDQGSADATVSVRERMDRLELGVGGRGLDDRGEIGAVDECAQVRKQWPNTLVRRRDVGRSNGVVVVATDPVLCLAHDAGDVGILGEAQQYSVDVLDVGRRERIAGCAELDRQLHRFDVSEDFGGASVLLSTVGLVDSTGESLMRQMDAFDPRGRHAL